MFASRHRSFSWLAAVAALALWSTGCGDDGGGGGSDGGGTDAATDTGTPDTGTPDGGTEAGTDGGAEGGTDAATDGGPMRMADLSCTTVGGTPPMVADPTTVTGRVFAAGLGAPSPVAGATVQAMAPRDDTATEAANDTSGADGSYSLEIPTGGTPWMGYLRAEATDHVSTNLFWATPFFMATHENVNVTLIPTTLWGILAGMLRHDSGNGVVLALVVDCAGEPIEGATVAAGDATVKYLDESNSPDDSLSATSAKGLAAIPNLMPGALTVTATYDGVTFRPQNVYVIADELTSVVLSPHGAEAMGGGSGGGSGDGSGGGMGGSGGGMGGSGT